MIDPNAVLLQCVHDFLTEISIIYLHLLLFVKILGLRPWEDKNVVNHKYARIHCTWFWILLDKILILFLKKLLEFFPQFIFCTKASELKKLTFLLTYFIYIKQSLILHWRRNQCYQFQYWSKCKGETWYQWKWDRKCFRSNETFTILCCNMKLSLHKNVLENKNRNL